MFVVWDIIQGVGVNIVVLDIGIMNYFDLDVNRVGGYDFVFDFVVGNDGNGCDGDFFDLGDWVMNVEVNGWYFGGCFEEFFSWYGIYVVGIVVVVINNFIGVVGVVYGVKVVFVCVLGKCGGFILDIVDGIVWVVGGSVVGVFVNINVVVVINFLLGGVGVCFYIYQVVINSVCVWGVIVVVVVGNKNISIVGVQFVNCEGVIVVVVMIVDGSKFSDFNFGFYVVLVVFGDEVVFMFNDGLFGFGFFFYGSGFGILMVVFYVVGVVVLLLV